MDGSGSWSHDSSVLRPGRLTSTSATVRISPCLLRTLRRSSRERGSGSPSGTVRGVGRRRPHRERKSPKLLGNRPRGGRGRPQRQVGRVSASLSRRAVRSLVRAESMPHFPRGQVHLEPLRAFVRHEEGLRIEMDLGDEDILHVSFEVPVVSDATDHAIPEQLILPGVPRLDESTVLLLPWNAPKWGTSYRAPSATSGAKGFGESRFVRAPTDTAEATIVIRIAAVPRLTWRLRPFNG